MNILLISKTQIVLQIFELICKKMSFNLTIKNTNDVKEHFDIIVVDHEFIDDRFNIIRQLSKKIGAITNEELSSDKSEYFLIKRPFLPTQLQAILKEQKEKIHEEAQQSKRAIQEDETTDEIAAFVDSLADDFISEDSEEDESIVRLDSLDGGVLDSLELDKINNILHQNEMHKELDFNEEEIEQHDWKELTDIIDDALHEVQGYEFSLTNEPLNIVLSQYNISELTPLLQKFDQNIIDKLSRGESIDLKLSLKAKN